MIKYDRLWEYMREHGVTKYRLHAMGISYSTLDRLKNNRSVNTDMLDRLCTILDCRLEDIAAYEKDQ